MTHIGKQPFVLALLLIHFYICALAFYMKSVTVHSGGTIYILTINVIRQVPGTLYRFTTWWHQSLVIVRNVMLTVYLKYIGYLLKNTSDPNKISLGNLGICTVRE